MLFMIKSNLAFDKEFFTDAEYLRIERQAVEKNELIGGRVVSMAGASENHNLISSNLFLEIGIQTKNTACRAFSSDMRVKAKIGNFYYPDVVVVCGERKYGDSKKDILINPQVIIEVLSKTTKLKDRNQKLDSYMSLESLTDYVLVEQDAMRIEHFIKINEKEWVVHLLTEVTESLFLKSIDCRIQLSEVYRDVIFLN